MYTLVSSRTGNMAFRVSRLEEGALLQEQKGYNYYSILLVTKGSGQLYEYTFQENTLLALGLYQPFQVKGDIEGVLINFHPDFFCIYQHEEEVACNGVLFNNIYALPLMQLQVDEMASLMNIVRQIEQEMSRPALAQYEVVMAFLKIFLINASRMKLERQEVVAPVGNEPFILQSLKDAIEQYYRKEHSPGYYAGLLNITPKALNKLSKTHFNRTLGHLIAERIMTEAKRELYMTAKPVKRIAFELGFNDEFYFSRFFKNNAEVSPLVYREAVGWENNA
ncbi:response regulator transcription factor [[Flexibacter] sp. ATCC 35208]|uniref:helix-turn-helix transcriptional regulator n=1 Tax=[Flexibacter] sp. ATCC 35208 TaxID=1936242 RepID=UPI0009D1BC5D|nr:response regulator transcription factor [[Flexibacter] sp. ATCC 35208]OMP76369.1 AraC family transcriptional regulator [[Flexibacter] sp. ATCC 35208]